jgi:hypothetical protein
MNKNLQSRAVEFLARGKGSFSIAETLLKGRSPVLDEILDKVSNELQTTILLNHSAEAVKLYINIVSQGNIPVNGLKEIAKTAKTVTPRCAPSLGFSFLLRISRTLKRRT